MATVEPSHKIEKNPFAAAIKNVNERKEYNFVISIIDGVFI